MWECPNCGIRNDDSSASCAGCGAAGTRLRPELEIAGAKLVPESGGDLIFGRTTIPGVTDRMDLSRSQLRIFRRGNGWACANVSRRVPVSIDGAVLAVGVSFPLDGKAEFDVVCGTERIKIRMVEP